MFKKYLSLSFLFCFFLCSFAVNAEPLSALFRHNSDPMVGNPHGDITIVEFFDYQCSHCMNMVPVIDNIVKNNKNVRFVFKDFPIRGDTSEIAARAAIAAQKQGKYYELYKALLNSDENLTEQSIFQHAQSLGININKLKNDMNAKRTSDQIDGNLNLGHGLEVPGTPVFYIAKTSVHANHDVNYVIGEMSESEMQDAINKISR